MPFHQFIWISALLGMCVGLIFKIALHVDEVPPPATVTVTVTPTAWTEPYGGCKEAARYPRSTGFAECQAHGLLP